MSEWILKKLPAKSVPTPDLKRREGESLVNGFDRADAKFNFKLVRHTQITYGALLKFGNSLEASALSNSTLSQQNCIAPLLFLTFVIADTTKQSKRTTDTIDLTSEPTYLPT
jgi:hypothetical protein